MSLRISRSESTVTAVVHDEMAEILWKSNPNLTKEGAFDAPGVVGENPAGSVGPLCTGMRSLSSVGRGYA